MQKTEQYYKTEIGKEIRRIMDEPQNQEAAAKFWDTLNNIKAKSCEVKSGGHAGHLIDFTLAFEKGGAEDPFNLFVEAIPDAAFRFGVIFGLWPEIFHFNPKYTISDETHWYMNFKLKRHE